MTNRWQVPVLVAVALGGWPVRAAAPTVEKQAHGATIRFDSGALRLEVWSSRVVRATYAQGTEIPVIHSLSVISAAAAVPFEIKETPAAVDLSTRALRAHVDKGTGLVSFRDLAGRTIFEEKGPRESTVGHGFALAPDEQIYGLGQHQDGYMSYRGTSVHLQQKNMEIGIPMLVSSRGYGMLWDNPAITDVEAGIEGKENVLRWISETGKAIDYYFLYGPKADDVIAAYGKLTGAAPLLGPGGRGVLGVQGALLDASRDARSRFAIPREPYAPRWHRAGLAVLETRRLGLTRVRSNPLSGPEGHGGLHPQNACAHPDLGVGAIRSRHRQWEGTGEGRRALPSRDSECVSEGARQVVRRLQCRRAPHLLETDLGPPGTMGMDGWWLDATEPEIGGKWGEYRTFSTAEGPGAAVFNAFPLMTTTGIYQGQRAKTDKKRVIVLTRSAYAGQQRNSAISWSGDIQGNWDVFRKQIPAGLNFSMSGVPYWNTDIGGFFGGNPEDPKYQELFVRWFQFGAFTPMFRVHGTGAGKEFWQFDQPTQKTLRNFERLRYRLMPYIYSVSVIKNA